MKQLFSIVFFTLALLHCGAGMEAAAQYYCPMPPDSSARRMAPRPGLPLACGSQYVIRVNVHFVLRDDGTGNFNETDDSGSHYSDGRVQVMGYTGLPVPASPVWNGYRVAEEVINLANSRNITNYQMLLPPGNTTPVVPKRLIYVLNGTYFHRSTALYDYDQTDYYGPNGIFDHAQFNTFGVSKDREVNIFFMGQNTNSEADEEGESPYAWLSGGASGLGFLSAAGQSTDGSNNIWTKMGNMWRVHILAKRDGAYSDVSGWPWPLDETGKMLNHEIGHLLTLGHPNWSSETCADNPPTTGGGNNTMVSGADQLALTPCQIKQMQAELGSYYEAYADCNPALPCRAFFTVPETINSCNAPQKVPFDGRGSFNEDRWALSVVEVDANNQPSAPPLLTTQANGPVGQLYIGPLAPYRRYLVALSVYRGPTQSHTVTKYINTACLSIVGPNQPPPATALYPNPATADFTVPYGEEPTALPIVRDNQGQPAPVERTASRYAGGQWHVTYRFAQPVPAGLYRVETGRGATRRVRVLSLQRP